MLIQKGAVRMRWRGPNANGDKSGWDRFLEKPAPPMDPEERYAINIGVGMVAYVINIGHSLRVTVTSSCYPYYSANPNTVRRARTASPLASRPSARAVSAAESLSCAIGSQVESFSSHPTHLTSHSSRRPMTFWNRGFQAESSGEARRRASRRSPRE